MTDVKRLIKMAAFMAVLLVPTACTDVYSPTGIWGLRTVNGEDLPYEIFNEGGVVTDVARALLFIRVEDCIYDATHNTIDNGTPRQPELISFQGDWEQTGESVAFVWETAVRWTAVLDRDILTVTDENGDVWVYERV